MNAKYIRVLPRDLFNESKLLKCVGRLILLIEDGLTPGKITYHHDGEPFRVALMDEGSLTITNISIWISGTGYTFKTTYNSKSNYPLHCGDDNYCDTLVFDEQGEFTEEFKSLCNGN